MIQKDYFKGKRCFIVGTGSSLNDFDMSLLENEITISFNNILLKTDFTPNYLCIADTTVMENNYDLIIIGDSFAEGIGIDFKDTFVGKLQIKYPNMKIRNVP